MTPTMDSNRQRESFAGFFGLVVLLLLSGITASVVGYKIKSADYQRKDTLQKTYLALGGIPEKPILATSDLNPSTLTDQQIVILAYEVNQHVRGFGLATLLKSVPNARWSSVEEALDRIEADDAAEILREAVTAYTTNPTVAPTDETLPSSVNKLARQYTSKVARGVEAKLFKYAVEKKLVPTNIA